MIRSWRFAMIVACLHANSVSDITALDRAMSRLLTAFFLVFAWGSGVTLRAEDPLLRPGDTLALVGGTFVERMQSTAALEDQLHCRRPDWNLRVRNLGWSGDDVHGFARKVFDTNAARGFERLMNDLRIAKPTVVMVAYGFAEASNGAAATDAFDGGLRKLVDALKAMECRVILMRPFVVPGVQTLGYAEQIARCRQMVDAVAAEKGAAVVDVVCEDWVSDGMAPSEAGYRSVGMQLADALVGGSPCDADAELQRMIVEKNELFFHRHRPQNETYLMLFRKHEQGNNVVELPQFDSLVEALEKQIWSRAATRK